MLVWLLVVGLFFLVTASRAVSQELYQWTDEAGKIHIVDEMRKVPGRYRQEVSIYKASSGLKKRSSIEEKEASAPALETSEAQEQTEISPLTREERIARMETLRRREDELEQEKFRQSVLERRFGGARANFYRKRVEQLDQEIEAIQKELEAIRPQEQ